MKAELYGRWVQALRSGEYRKWRLSLSNLERTHHCCLGVLAELIGVDLEPNDATVKEEYISSEKQDLLAWFNDRPGPDDYSLVLWALESEPEYYITKGD